MDEWAPDWAVAGYLADRVRREKEAGTSLRDIAERADISHATLSQLARGGRGAGNKVRERLAMYFRLSANALQEEARAWQKAHAGLERSRAAKAVFIADHPDWKAASAAAAERFGIDAAMLARVGRVAPGDMPPRITPEWIDHTVHWLRHAPT